MSAVVHVLTTATLDRLRGFRRAASTRRFRPNVVIRTEHGDGFVENAWVGRALSLGDDVRIEITEPCSRCVMTTLPQGDIPKDPAILRAAAKHNGVKVGLYAAVLRGGWFDAESPLARVPTARRPRGGSRLSRDAAELRDDLLAVRGERLVLALVIR